MSNDVIQSGKVHQMQQRIEEALRLKNEAIAQAGEATKAAWYAGREMIELAPHVGEKSFKKFFESHVPNLPYEVAKVWMRVAKDCTLDQIEEDNNRRQLMLSLDILPAKQHNTQGDRKIPTRVSSITLLNKFEAWQTQFQREHTDFSELSDEQKRPLRRDLWPLMEWVCRLYNLQLPPSKESI